MEANNATMIDYYITLDMAKQLAMVDELDGYHYETFVVNNPNS